MRSLLIGRVHLSWGLPHSYIWRHRLVVRTPPFHGGNVGSNPAGVTSVRELRTERCAVTQAQPHRPKLGVLLRSALSDVQLDYSKR